VAAFCLALHAFLTLRAHGAGSEYLIDFWQTDQGLPQNTVTAITQTRDGYLWVGTLGGLARFDGARFTVFTSGGASGPGNDRILCLREDRTGALWIGTDGGGLSRYEAGAFTTLTMTNGLLSDRVLSLAEDAQGTLWIGTEGGLNRWAEGRLSLLPEAGGGSATSPAVYGMHVDRSNRLWIASGNRISQFANGGLSTYLAEGLFNRAAFRIVFEDRAGSLWMGKAEPDLLRLRDGKLTAYGEANGLAAGQVFAICESRSGDLWIGAEHGLSRLRGGRWSTYTIADGLANHSVRALLEDREGSLWVGTDGGGLNRLKRRQLTTYTTKDGLTQETVLALSENSAGGVWVGLNGGGLNQGRNGVFAAYKESGLLPSNSAVYSLLAGRDGGFWIGTFGDGLFRVQEGQSTHFSTENGLGSDKILALCEDRDGTLWIGAYQGLFKLGKDGQPGPVTEEPALANIPVTSIIQDQEGALWFGTTGNGLLRYHHDYWTNFTREDGLLSESIRTLYDARDGALYIGTGGGGLSRWKRGVITSVAAADGLPDNVVSQILQDARGDFWLGSNKGIIRVRRLELEAAFDGHRGGLNPILYGKEEGMLGLECTGGFCPAGLKTRDGKLWFSTVNGLVVVDPANVRPNPTPPPVWLERLVIDGRRVELSRALRAEAPAVTVAGTPATPKPAPLLIFPGNHRLEFQYTALSFVAPEKVRFKYQLIGYDQEWVDAGVNRAATYTEVPTGDYWFRVMACNNDGLWNEIAQPLALRVIPPFWKRWWFVALSGLLFTAIVGGAARVISGRKMKRKLERLQQQHAVEKERARIAQDMHDEIGAKLTKISFLSGVAKRDLHEPARAAVEIENISQTARELLRGLDEIVWAVSPQNDSLDGLATYICQHAAEYFQKTDIICRLEIPTDLPHVPVPTDFRHNVYLTVKEALTNILKHSGASEVRIRLQLRASLLVIGIEDNGRGFTAPLADARPANGHGVSGAGRQGCGLSNMRKRIEEAGGRFELVTRPDRGTRITISVALAAHGAKRN